MDNNSTSVSISNAVDSATGMLETSLKTLEGIMHDSSQTGAARVSACKVLLDCAIKLDAYQRGITQSASTGCWDLLRDISPIWQDGAGAGLTASSRDD